MHGPMHSRYVNGRQHRWALLGQQGRCRHGPEQAAASSTVPARSMTCGACRLSVRNSAVPCMSITLPHMTGAVAAVRAQDSWQLSDAWGVRCCCAALLADGSVRLCAALQPHHFTEVSPLIWGREVCDECCTAMLEVHLPCMCEQRCT